MQKFPLELKKQIVEEANRPGVLLKNVTSKYGVSAASIHLWRRKGIQPRRKKRGRPTRHAEPNFEVNENVIPITDDPKNQIVTKDGKPWVSSRVIADGFGRKHDSILRSIQNLECSKEFADRNFAVAKYHDKNSQLRKQYHMTKDGFIFVAMGLQGKKAALIKEKYINAFNQMEAELRQSKPLIPQF